MRIAITGGTGFIGKWVLKILTKKKNIQIINLYRTKKFNNPKVKNIKFDFHNKVETNFYKKILKPDILIHLAWDNLKNHDSKSHLTTYKKNLHFLNNLINSKIKKIFIMGTCFEYGLKKQGLLKENYKTYPSNCYSIAKDKLRKSILKKDKYTKIIWGRLFYIYGEHQSKKTLYGSLMESIRKKSKVFNMSPGNQKRDFLHVSEVAKYIILLALNYPNTVIINICSGKGIKLSNIVNKWLKDKKYKIKLNLGYYDHSNKEPLHFWGSNKKLKSIKIK